MLKNYTLYTIEDFVADEYFQQWVKEPTEGSNIFWKQWIADHPEKKWDIEEAKSFINNLHFHSEIPGDRQIESSLRRNLQKIASLEDCQNPRHTRSSFKLYAYWLSAAVITGILAVLGWQYWFQKSVTIELITGTGEIKTVVLPDSSVITLNENSSIRYPSNLNSVNDRQVRLEGEAFFEIKHIEENKSPKRFIVHSGNLNVEVLGTTFNVKKRGSLTNVTLNTGKIKIDLENDPGSVIYLQPGDFVQYSPADKRLVKKQVRSELYSVWKDEKIQLDNMPLSEIAQLIRDTYGYKVEIEKNLEDDRISGKLILKNEEGLLETLSFVLNINIVKKDSVLLFQSKAKN